MNRRRVESTVKTIMCAGALAAGIFCGAAQRALAATHPIHAPSAAHSAAADAARFGARQASRAGILVKEPVATPERATATQALDDRSSVPGTTPFPERPWIEGYEPLREDELFRATYPLLPSHNILKVYVADDGAYGAAGIRFSARVPHTAKDISASEMEREAATLIRTTFERFRDVQTLDVWATIPVKTASLTTVDSTVFSISADRPTYLSIRDRSLPDAQFLAAFGRVWLAPQVPR